MFLGVCMHGFLLGVYRRRAFWYEAMIKVVALGWIGRGVLFEKVVDIYAGLAA